MSDGIHQAVSPIVSVRTEPRLVSRVEPRHRQVSYVSRIEAGTFCAAGRVNRVFSCRINQQVNNPDMKFEEHCAESVIFFGEPFEYVHLWLDEFAGKKPYGMKHRRLRHHLAGVREVERLWGPEAARAAKQHIISDLMMEGWNEGEHFPVDEDDYVRMGLF